LCLVVKAFRILDFDCYGCDVSEYAIQKVDSEVVDFCKLCSDENLIPFKNMKFDWIISKDVMEHMTEKEVKYFLRIAKDYTQKMFLVIPLGKDDKYIAPEYDKDITHVLAKEKDWWFEKIESNGWRIKKFSYKFRGVKENWTSIYPRANGFFIIERI